jgi:L-fuculose-phosphate aldolase
MYTVKRRDLLDICRLVYDRELTNSAGSNFSGRASSETLYVSINGNAKRNRLRMTADDLLLMKMDGTILEGEGKPSQSWPTHRRIYMEFDFIGVVIHAHPKYATALACRNSNMHPLLDSMKKYGEIPVLPRHLKVDSPEFGEAIVEIFKSKGESFQKHGHGVMYPYHGVLVAAPTLDDAYDLLERMEDNALSLMANALWDLTNFGTSVDPLSTVEVYE